MKYCVASKGRLHERVKNAILSAIYIFAPPSEFKLCNSFLSVLSARLCTSNGAYFIASFYNFFPSYPSVLAIVFLAPLVST